MPFTTLPSFQLAFGHIALRPSSVLPIPLPPEVANGIIVLPENQNFPPPPPWVVPEDDVCVAEPPEESLSFGFAVRFTCE